MNITDAKTKIDFFLAVHKGNAIIKLKWKERHHKETFDWLRTNWEVKFSKTFRGWYVVDSDLARVFFQLPSRVETTRKIILTKRQAARFVVLMYISPNNQKATEALHNEIVLHGMSPSTLVTYVNEFKQILYLLGDIHVQTLTIDKIKSYLLLCISTLGVKESQLNQRINAIKFYFEKVLKKEKMLFDLPRPQKPSLLPKVLDTSEVKKIFDAKSNIKHKTLLMLAYGAGLRVSEIANLKLNNIDSARMQIRIENGKGKRDRMVMLSEKLLEMLRQYYKAYLPKAYLFEGMKTGQHLTVRSIQNVFKSALGAAKIKKQMGIHGMRHRFATHLLETGTDIRVIQELLGHSSPETTMIYTHVSKKMINKVQSPLDRL
ncbi:MAG: tyrosine-type recombinase/integrase [Cytophagales bacterium]